LSARLRHSSPKLQILCMLVLLFKWVISPHCSIFIAQCFKYPLCLFTYLIAQIASLILQNQNIFTLVQDSHFHILDFITRIGYIFYFFKLWSSKVWFEKDLLRVDKISELMQIFLFIIKKRLYLNPNIIKSKINFFCLISVAIFNDSKDIFYLCQLHSINSLVKMMSLLNYTIC